MSSYKPEQGRMARMATFWSLAILVFYGCYSLRGYLTRFDSLSGAIGGLSIPILGIALSPAFLIAALLFGAAMFLLVRWQSTPKVADLLIETESEMKKVTWPTGTEVINSSVVVIVSVLVMMGFLALSDFVISQLAGALLGI